MIVKVLDNIRVLICRPEPSASELAHTLESVGATCHLIPAIERTPLALSEASKTKILNLDQYDHVISVSHMAAEIAMEHIDEYWPQLPVDQHWHAIGRKTAQVLDHHLQSYNIKLIRPEKDFTSEDLLNSFQNQAELQDKKILLLKGEGGRTHLRDELEKLGAQVDDVALYKRTMPSYSEDQIKAAFVKFEPDLIVTLSAETVENTFSLANSCEADLSDLTFIVSSERVGKVANEKGVTKCIVPNGLMPIDLIKAIAEFKRKAL